MKCKEKDRNLEKEGLGRFPTHLFNNNSLLSDVPGLHQVPFEDEQRKNKGVLNPTRRHANGKAGLRAK